MATTTSKSKAKTKTTKKPVTKKTTVTKKSAKQTASAAVVTKKTTKKPLTKEVKLHKPSNKKATRSLTFEKIKAMQLFSAGIFGLLAVSAFWLMSDATVSESITYAVPDLLASPDGNVLVQASQELWTVQVRWLLAAVMGVSAVFSLLYALRMSKRYEAYVTYGAVKLRWIEIAVTFGILAKLVALVSGLQSTIVLSVIFALVAVYALLAWVTERFHVAGQSTRALFTGTALVALLPVFIIGLFSISSLVYGEVAHSWYIYVAQATLLLGLVLFLRNQLKQVKLNKQWLSNLYVERNYLTINLLTKVVIAGALIVGFQQ